MKNAPEVKYVALLRGINVGGHTQIRMEELRKTFGSLGFRKVKTVLASGNVIFETPEKNTAVISRAISLKLIELLGREVSVIVRPLDDLRELGARQPFKGIEVGPKARLIVTFYPEGPGDHDIAGLPVHEGFRILSASGGMICSVLYDTSGVGTPVLMGAIQKEFGPDVTTRTWNTILRVLKMGGTG
jgi:uncharacterized protein (DUF1697 family)